MFFIHEAVKHFAIGVGVCIFFVLMFLRSGKRRMIFRFGGDSPFSMGTKNKWISLYLLSYVFEFFTSFLWGVGNRMYLELALSSYQAVFFTFGLFLIDRLASLFVEPSDDFKFARKRVLAGNTPAPQTPPAEPEGPVETPPFSTETAVAEVSVPKKRSWIGERLAGLKKKASEKTGAAKDKILDLPGDARNVVSAELERRREHKAAGEALREEERKARLARLNKSLKDY